MYKSLFPIKGCMGDCRYIYLPASSCLGMNCLTNLTLVKETLELPTLFYPITKQRPTVSTHV